MSLEAEIAKLRTHLGNLAGLRRVYDDPPESMSEFPCGIAFALRGNYEFNAAGGRSLHTLIAEIHLARQVLPQAVDAAKVWPDLLYQELKGADDMHVVWPFSYQAAALQYGANASEVHYGIRFEVQVKVNET